MASHPFLGGSCWRRPQTRFGDDTLQMQSRQREHPPRTGGRGAGSRSDRSIGQGVAGRRVA
eukprot:scaffold47379_cov67-Phaeocystis_antarctica.AAC.6